MYERRRRAGEKPQKAIATPRAPRGERLERQMLNGSHGIQKRLFKSECKKNSQGIENRGRYNAGLYRPNAQKTPQKFTWSDRRRTPKDRQMPKDRPKGEEEKTHDKKGKRAQIT